MGKFLIGLVFMFVGLFGATSFAQGGAGGRSFTQEYVYDFAVQGGAVGFKSLVSPANPLPVGAIVTAVHYRMVTAMTSGGSATVAIGNILVPAAYKAATAFGDSTYALNFVAAGTGVPDLISGTEGNVGITIATAALTAGKMVIVVSGYVPKQ